jgi:hypothetical protein
MITQLHHLKLVWPVERHHAVEGLGEHPQPEWGVLGLFNYFSWIKHVLYFMGTFGILKFRG